MPANFWIPVSKAMATYCVPFFRAVDLWISSNDGELIENRLLLIDQACEILKEWVKLPDLVFDLVAEHPCALKPHVKSTCDNYFEIGDDQRAFKAAQSSTNPVIFQKGGIYFQNHLLEALAGFDEECIATFNHDSRKSAILAVEKLFRLPNEGGQARFVFYRKDEDGNYSPRLDMCFETVSCYCEYRRDRQESSNKDNSLNLHVMSQNQNSKTTSPIETTTIETDQRSIGDNTTTAMSIFSSVALPLTTNESIQGHNLSVDDLTTNSQLSDELRAATNLINLDQNILAMKADDQSYEEENRSGDVTATNSYDLNSFHNDDINRNEEVANILLKHEINACITNSDALTSDVYGDVLGFSLGEDPMLSTSNNEHGTFNTIEETNQTISDHKQDEMNNSSMVHESDHSKCNNSNDEAIIEIVGSPTSTGSTLLMTDKATILELPCVGDDSTSLGIILPPVADTVEALPCPTNPKEQYCVEASFMSPMPTCKEELVSHSPRLFGGNFTPASRYSQHRSKPLKLTPVSMKFFAFIKSFVGLPSTTPNVNDTPGSATKSIENHRADFSISSSGSNNNDSSARIIQGDLEDGKRRRENIDDEIGVTPAKKTSKKSVASTSISPSVNASNGNTNNKKVATSNHEKQSNKKNNKSKGSETQNTKNTKKKTSKASSDKKNANTNKASGSDMADANIEPIVDTTMENNEPEEEIQWVTTHRSIGTKVAVYFDIYNNELDCMESTIFKGSIVKYAPPSGPRMKDQLYHVMFEDGDEQDMDENELLAGKRLYDDNFFEWFLDHESVGTHVAGYFMVPVSKKTRPGQVVPTTRQLVIGKVVKYAPPSRANAEDQLYHVIWDDGDEQDLDQLELDIAVQLYESNRPENMKNSEVANNDMISNDFLGLDDAISADLDQFATQELFDNFVGDSVVEHDAMSENSALLLLKE